MPSNALFLEKNCRTQSWSVQALGAHQYTLPSFKKLNLSRNLDQNKLKNALFFGKSWKNRAALVITYSYNFRNF